jgi:hypothetical protein
VAHPVAFEAVLDRALETVHAAAASTPAFAAGDAGLRLLLSGLHVPRVAGRLSRVPASSGPLNPGGSRIPPETTAKQPRPRARIVIATRAQHEALATLRSLGAAHLGEELAIDDLRRAFRMLAQRLHPDRHPHLTPVARGRLSAQFAEAAGAYRLLTGRSR